MTNYKTPSNMEMIEKYLEGTLDSKARSSFEERLTKDINLRRMLQFERDFQMIISDDDSLNFRRKLMNIQLEEIEFTAPKTIPLRRIILRVAAAITLLIGMGSIWMLVNSTTLTNPEAFDKYYDKYENANYRSSSNGELVSAMNLYQNKEYTQAINSFDSFLENEPNNIAVHFYKGISLIEVGNVANAIKEFNLIIQNSNNLYVEHAEWYLGLCYLKQNETNKAIIKLTEIANSADSYYKVEASELLKKLNKN